MTPMMKQYYDIKGRTPDSILFFRLGDFYEMFGDDALLVSKELNIALTTRDRSAEGDSKIPMCGVPHHSAQPHIAKLISKGYKIAICEQLEDPMLAKGLVERDVVRMITPGTLMDSSMLDEGKPNYICSVYTDTGTSAACFADLSTGEISVTEIDGNDIHKLENELAAYTPSEALLLCNQIPEDERTGADMNYSRIKTYLEKLGCLVNYYVKDNIDGQPGAEESFSFPPDITQAQKKTVSTLLCYLKETQKTDIKHFQALRINKENAYMEMDLSTIRNLELVGSLRAGDKKGALLGVLDKTKTPMGKRLMRSWVLHPLLSVTAVKRRHSAVTELVSVSMARAEIIDSLRKVSDIERLIGKIAFGNAGYRDMKALSHAISILPELTRHTVNMNSAVMRECSSMDTLADIASVIDSTLVDELPVKTGEGGFIKDGFDNEVDKLRKLLGSKTETLKEIEAREQERTGKKVKVSYNRVFGYYIELTRSASNDVPDDYIRKQTLTNCERFITEELKLLETELLSAKDNLLARENKLFEELRLAVAAETKRVQDTAYRVAQLDVLCTFADVAACNNYCMPEIDTSGIIDIKDGRHPVVELTQTDSLFVPNDIYLDCDKNTTAIITGPNMAGKSTYMRQTALIVLMAQIGSFVPARSARIGIVDRVFTRIGASDDISAGKSTFMVEMTEVADILANATRNSLLILDEIGRGTSTYDGMSVARAVLEHCADKRKLGAKTMFATHYHELALLEDEIEGIKNYNISAKKRGDDIIFLRKIVPGSTDDSYGIEVAGLAGVPGSVIKRAKEILASLENDNAIRNPSFTRKSSKIQEDNNQLSLLDMSAVKIAETLKNTDINTLTPLEALNLLYELKKKL